VLDCSAAREKEYVGTPQRRRDSEQAIEDFTIPKNKKKNKRDYATFAYSIDRNSVFVAKCDTQNSDITHFLCRRLQCRLLALKLVSFERQNIFRFSGR
jgi:hypothetical protein